MTDRTAALRWAWILSGLAYQIDELRGCAKASEGRARGHAASVRRSYERERAVAYLASASAAKVAAEATNALEGEGDAWKRQARDLGDLLEGIDGLPGLRVLMVELADALGVPRPALAELGGETLELKEFAATLLAAAVPAKESAP